MQIRHAASADLEAISRLESEGFPREEAASFETLKGRLEAYGSHFWVLEEEGRVLAFAGGPVTEQRDLTDDLYADPSCHEEGGSWQMIFGLVTDRAFRRKGLASAVMRECIRESRTQGRRGVVLTCKEALLPLYTGLGFRDEGLSVSTHGGAAWHAMRLTFEPDKAEE